MRCGGEIAKEKSVRLTGGGLGFIRDDARRVIPIRRPAQELAIHKVSIKAYQKGHPPASYGASNCIIMHYDEIYREHACEQLVGVRCR